MTIKIPKISKKITPWLLLLVLFFSSLASSWAAETYPPKPGNNIYVSDLAAILSPATEQAILDLGSQVEQTTTAQLIVVTVPSLNEQPIQDYANGLFRAWGIGQKDKNNGVLLLVPRDDRRVRVE